MERTADAIADGEPESLGGVSAEALSELLVAQVEARLRRAA